MKIVSQENGLYSVVDDNRVVARDLSNRKAWRIFDKLTGEATSKAEATSDWVFKQMADRK